MGQRGSQSRSWRLRGNKGGRIAAAEGRQSTKQSTMARARQIDETASKMSRGSKRLREADLAPYPRCKQGDASRGYRLSWRRRGEGRSSAATAAQGREVQKEDGNDFVHQSGWIPHCRCSIMYIFKLAHPIHTALFVGWFHECYAVVYSKELLLCSNPPEMPVPMPNAHINRKTHGST